MVFENIEHILWTSEVYSTVRAVALANSHTVTSSIERYTRKSYAEMESCTFRCTKQWNLVKAEIPCAKNK